MDEYYALARQLPHPYDAELSGLNPQLAPFVQEIRLRAGQPVLFTVKGRLTPCSKYLPRASACRRLDRKALQECFLALCRHSAYACEDELRHGYFTIPGGNRVGVAGTRGPAGLACVTSLNLRVARWVTCELPPEILQALSVLTGGVLVAGVPGSGKTTFLRSMIQYLGRSDRVFCVVDERGELLWGGADGLPSDRSIPCDVYTQYPKAEAICMALRSLNPQAIVCDELGTAADAEALEAGLASGVVFLASVHCDSIENLEKRPQLARLLQTGAFRTAVLLDGRSRPGQVAQVTVL
ncbi:MAG TPA: Flp pilus assembly complex ATPase component TadA [Candidatus Gemmiger faecigallinarum]|nr:Flp pilus assembly complex ATPase component TadA [Candidatus Gemmiger faecigallinarum]